MSPQPHLVLPLPGVDPTAAPCSYPLLSPAGCPPPPVINRLWEPLEGPLSALAGSLSSDVPCTPPKGGGTALA